MAAVGVDNDAWVVQECGNGNCPFACRRWRRRSTSIRHVVDYDRHLRRLRRHYEIRGDALLNGLQHNLTSIEVSGAADLER
jgi:DNA-binding transcriptional MocR family regulator